MVGGLAETQLFLLLVELCLIRLDLLLRILDLPGKFRDLLPDPCKLRFIGGHDLLLFFALSQRLQKEPVQLCLADPDLFLGGIVMLNLGPGRGTVVQKLHDLLLAGLHLRRLSGNPALHRNQGFLRLLILSGHLQQPAPDFLLFPGEFLHLALPGLNLDADGMETVVIVLVVHPNRVDLLL